MKTVILSVEDDDATYRLLAMAFKDLGLAVTLQRAVDGEEALHFLHQRGAFLDAPRPSLILLNLNLPKQNGVEVLTAIQSNESLASIPVVMFTSSDLDEDRARCLALGAKAYIKKPMDYNDILVAVKSAFAMSLLKDATTQVV